MSVRAGTLIEMKGVERVSTDADVGTLSRAEVRDQAREMFRQSVEVGFPMSGRAVGERFGMSERWGQEQVRAVKNVLQNDPQVDLAGAADDPAGDLPAAENPQDPPVDVLDHESGEDQPEPGEQPEPAAPGSPSVEPHVRFSRTSAADEREPVELRREPQVPSVTRSSERAPAEDLAGERAGDVRRGWFARRSAGRSRSGEAYSARLARLAAESQRVRDTLDAHPDLYATPGEKEIEDRLRHAEALRRAEMKRELRESEHQDEMQEQEWTDQEETRQEMAARHRLASPVGRLGEARAVGRLGTNLAGVLMLMSVIVGAINVHTNWANTMTVRDPMWWGWWVFDPIATVALVAMLILRARYAQLGAQLGEGVMFGRMATWVVEAVFFAITAYMNGHGDWSTAAQVIAHMLPPVLLVGAQLLQWLNASTSAHLVSIEAARMAD